MLCTRPSCFSNVNLQVSEPCDLSFNQVPVKCISSQLYVRISAHVYNTLEDYQKLADAVLKIREQNSVTYK